MSWQKSRGSLVDAFHDALPKDRAVERRNMFGCPCAFVGGNMFCGLHEQRLFVRLSEAKRESLLGAPGAARFEPTKGRVMREYVVVPPAMLRDRAALRRWIREGFLYAGSLPPKPSKHK
jgi:TfoX/Sxy family transcriptional regulator of competence genes